MTESAAVGSIQTVLPSDLASAEASVRAALAEQGFGVLTEIDVAQTLRDRLGVERAPMKILGACNPAFANAAIEIDPSVALVLPCNVVIEQTDAGSRVSAVDPMELMSDPRFSDLAEEVGQRLRDAMDAVSAPVSGSDG